MALEVSGDVNAFTSLLDSVVGGGARFDKLSDGLPAFGDSSATEEL